MHAAGLFRDCLFRVLPQQQYSAQRELAKFVAAGGDTGAPAAAAAPVGSPSAEDREDDAVAVSARLSALQDRARKEEEANNAVVAHFAGAIITYGGVVQLQHVKSGRVRAGRACCRCSCSSCCCW